MICYLYFTRLGKLAHDLWLIMGDFNFIKAYIDFSFLLTVVEPNWDYFVHAPLDQGVIRFETKTERALFAKVVASEANWRECQSSKYLNIWLRARQDLEAFKEGFRKNRKS